MTPPYPRDMYPRKRHETCIPTSVKGSDGEIRRYWFCSDRCPSVVYTDEELNTGQDIVNRFGQPIARIREVRVHVPEWNGYPAQTVVARDAQPIDLAQHMDADAYAGFAEHQTAGLRRKAGELVIKLMIDRGMAEESTYDE